MLGPTVRIATLGGIMTCLRRTAALGVWILLVLVAVPLPVAALDLKLTDSLPAPGNNLVQLRPIGSNPAPAEPAVDVKKYLSIAQTQDARYTLGLKNIEHAVASQFFTYEFLVWRNSGDRETTQVLFNVTSTGSFADFFKDIPFAVIEGAGQASGSINLPVHSLDPAPVCRPAALPTSASPLRVFLSGDTEYTVSLQCPDAASVPKLVQMSGPSGHGAYWKRLGYESPYYGPSGPAKPLTAKSFNLLQATLTPNVLAAVGARFRRFSVRDSPDDTVVFDLAYAIQPAGLEIPMKIEIPVVFYPFISVIAGALSAGVLLGWIGSMLLLLVGSKAKPAKTAIGAFVLGLVLSVIAYALLLLADSANCRVELFGLKVNPADVLVLFALGLICGCVAVLKVEDLRKRLNWIFGKMGLGGAPAAGLVALLLGGFWCAPLQAAGGQLALVGLSACPDGEVIGLLRDGAVIQFSGGPGGAWRRSGRLSSAFNAAELTCASLEGGKTAFVTAMRGPDIWLVRMDVASGKWSEARVASGISAGIAFDPAANRVFLPSIKERAIYQVSPALQDPRLWASIFGRAESIGSLAVDSAGNRLLVGEAFSGIVYSLALDSRRQGTVTQGLGSVNSLAVDQRRNLLYIADAGRRAVWVVSLAGAGPQRPRIFYREDQLKAVTGVAADADSNVWVAIHEPGRVIVLRPDGVRLGVRE
jgi:hypothetical protein